MIKILIYIITLISVILWLEFFTLSWFPMILDSTFYPINELKWFFTQSLYQHFLDIITVFLWYEIFSKLFVVSVLVIWAILWVYIGKLVNNLLEIEDKKISLFNIILWITFVSLNPFSYERFLTQTWIILWVYFVWLWLVFLMNYILYKKNINLYISSLFFWISLNIFPHSIVFLIIIWVITLAFYLKRFSIKKILLSVWIVILLNINWLYWNFFLKTDIVSSKVTSFNMTNIEAFKSNSLNSLWTDLTNLLLYWFWGEKYWHIYTPDLVNKKWHLAWFIVLFIVIVWIYYLFRKQKKITLYLVSLMIISYILSLWISSNLFAGINKFLYEYIPYYIGMREPQKLTWLVMFIYSIFFLSGIIYIAKIIHKTKLKSYLSKYTYNYYYWFFVIFLILIIWSPNVLWGYNWQLKIWQYPNNYFEIKEKIKTNTWKTVIFPRHLYMACNWSRGKKFANPLKKIIDSPLVIWAINIEIWNLYSNDNSKESKDIELFLKYKNYYLLRKNNIGNIIFMKNCADNNNYTFLEKDVNLEKTFSWQNIDIFKIKK